MIFHGRVYYTDPTQHDKLEVQMMLSRPLRRVYSHGVIPHVQVLSRATVKMYGKYTQAVNATNLPTQTDYGACASLCVETDVQHSFCNSWQEVATMRLLMQR